MIYTVTAWEEGWCIWEWMYDQKPMHDEIVDDMLQDGLHADDYDHISIQKDND